MHGQAFFQVVRQFEEVATVRLRQDQFEDLLPPRRNHLFAHPANGQYMPGQGQLAGHGHAFFRRLVAGQRQQGAGHGHPGTRPVLRRGAFRHVQVDEGFVEEGRVTAELLQVRADVAVGDLGGLLHHVAQLPGEFETTVQRVNTRGLDRQGGAAHAGPGKAGDHALARQYLFAAEHRHAQCGFEVLGGNLDHCVGLIEQAHHGFAHQFAQLLFQLPHTGLAGIALDDAAQGGIGDAQAGFRHAGFLQLLGPQVALGNGKFFFGDVAGQADHFHTVEQRPGNRIQGVGGTHEQHLGQVQAQVEVVVEEVDVLLGIEGFQQRRGGIALVALAHLVDLVEHDHRVHHFDVFQCLHQLARLRADVGAAMALDLGLVTHAADAEAVERSTQGLGDGLADAGLAHARRPHQQHDRAADLAFVGAHGEEFEDAFLDVVEPGVVLVEHLARVFEAQLVFAIHAPRQGRGPVQVIAGDRVLRRAGFEDRQLAQFFVDAFLRGGRQGLVLQALLELFEVGAAVVLGQAQLLLDHLELFLEEELALVLADLPVHLGGDFVLQARDFDFLAQHRQDFFHALEHRHAVEHFLQLQTGGRGQGGGEVGQWRRVVGAEAVEVVLQLLAVQRVERQQFLDRVDQGHAVGLDLVGGLRALVRVFHFHQVRWAMVLEPGADAHPGQALGDELQLAVFAAGVVHLDQGAVQRQGRGVEMTVVFQRRVHEEQRQRVVRGLRHQVEGFCPGFFVDDHRQHLRGEERAIVNRDHIDLVRQLLAGQGESAAGGIGGFEMFAVGVIVGMFREILLVAHGAPA